MIGDTIGGLWHLPAKIGQPFPPLLVRGGVFQEEQAIGPTKKAPSVATDSFSLSLSVPLSDAPPKVTWALDPHEEEEEVVVAEPENA